jgi:predicted RNase H-like nuclease
MSADIGFKTHELNQRLARLGQFAAKFQENGFVFAEMHGGSKIKPGAYEMPWSCLNETAARFYQQCYDDGWVLPGFDWMEWIEKPEARGLLCAPENPSTGVNLPSASPEQLAMVLTALIRNDRGCEGYLEGAHASGLLTSIVRRAEDLVQLLDGNGANQSSVATRTDTYIGFDSAWTDNRKAPGAICAVKIKHSRLVQFFAPRLATFDEALAFIRKVSSENGVTLVALDQPTVVPNLTGTRPVERVAASVVSWLGGGVQPSNRGKLGMFCDASPIWHFLKTLRAVQDPEKARQAVNGLYLIEVFPALALASLSTGFFGRSAAPKYNPGNKKKFRLDDWVRVAEAAAKESHCACWSHSVGGCALATSPCFSVI